jgi:ABC-type uncharacterized transport system substrate-binding protein
MGLFVFLAGGFNNGQKTYLLRIKTKEGRMNKTSFYENIIPMITFVLLIVIPFNVIAKDINYKTTPLTNNGRKWQIGYYEGGPYSDYQSHLKAAIKGLMMLGWMEEAKFPKLPDTEDTKVLWNWLSTNSKSKYIEFADNAYWSSNWDKKMRSENRKACIKQLSKGDIDFMFALGTWAGQDLANDEHSVPTFCLSISDPIKAKVIQSAEDSGYDHIIARCDPTRYMRQIRLFHDIIRFKKLGVVYEDTPDGRTYAGLEDLREIGNERGFEVVECIALDLTANLQKAVEEYAECCKILAPKIEAFYFTDHIGAHTDYLSKPLAPLFKYKIPTWTRRGSEQVKHGVLMSIAKKNFEYYSPYYGETIGKILNGARPRDLNQVLREPLKLSINLETAKIIDYNVPNNVLKVADIVYDKIEKCKAAK